LAVTNKERFQGICHFRRTGDLYYREVFGIEVLREWVKQGAPEQLLKYNYSRTNSTFLEDYFQCFSYFSHPRHLAEVRTGLFKAVVRGPIDLGYGIRIPEYQLAYEPRIVSEDEHTVTYINGSGQTVRMFKNDPFKMPTFVDWPVKDKATWKEHKKMLDPTTPGRFPEDWDAYVQKMKKVGEEQPLQLSVGGFYGWLRDWVGSENILYMFYDNPSLIEDMMEQVLYLETEIIDRTLKDIKVDMASFWEDMAYKAGPLISPAMVRKFMVPRYKKITDLLHSYGVDVIFLDCDGNIDQLVPIWLEVGINFIWPFEVAAGNDAVAARKKYGKDLIIGGAIDKRALIKGKEAIGAEVMSKVPFLLEQGGYFPSVDHIVPPDVKFENYCYYINLMREIAGLEKIAF